MKKNVDLILKEIIKGISLQGLETEIEVEDITDSTDLIDDLGFHSMISIRFIVEIEENFHIEIDEEIFEGKLLKNYGQLRDFIDKTVNG